jgi:hypothetical protein
VTGSTRSTAIEPIPDSGRRPARDGAKRKRMSQKGHQRLKAATQRSIDAKPIDWSIECQEQTSPGPSVRRTGPSGSGSAVAIAASGRCSASHSTRVSARESRRSASRKFATVLRTIHPSNIRRCGRALLWRTRSKLRSESVGGLPYRHWGSPECLCR